MRPQFVLDGNRETVAEICHRLDSLPLAIELAAARVKLLPPQKLLERLDQRLPLLTGGARDVPERHQTLRATIDWSFGLLDEDEQRLLARLSVFASGFTLDAAEAVCDATVDGLASLIDKSLVTAREDGDEPRFAMLETVREYARERLAGSGELAEIELRHARYMLELAEIACEGYEANPPDVAAMERLSRELDNVRAAIAALRDAGDARSAAQLARSTYWALWSIGAVIEMHRWLEGALENVEQLDPPLRADVFGALALAAAHVGDAGASHRYAETSLELSRELGDKARIEWALRALTFTEPDPAESRRLLQECERLLRELGDENGLAWVGHNLARCALQEGDYDEAVARFGRTASDFRRLGRSIEEANSQAQLGMSHLLAGRDREARAVLEISLRAALDHSSMPIAVEALALFGALMQRECDARGAARVLAAVSVLQDELGASLEAQFDSITGPATDALRKQLGDVFERESQIGSRLSLEHAAALALGDA